MKIVIAVLFSLFTIFLPTREKHLIKESITPEELSKWIELGTGKASVSGNETLTMEETDGSDGYFLINPISYKGDLIINYQAKALSESSVMIVLFSATNDDGSELSLLDRNATPKEINQWRGKMKHYNATFNNRSHNYKPFLFKNISARERGFSLNLADNIMETEKWYDVEIGKVGNQVWLKIDDEFVFNQTDENPLEGGHMMLRVSGTTGENTILAKAAIKSLVIQHE